MNRLPESAGGAASRGYERTLLVLLFFTWGTVFLDRMSQLYLAPYFAPEFRLDSEQIGLLASVLAITWAVSGFFFGAVSDRFGRRRVLLPAVFVFSGLSLLSGLARTFGELMLVRALMGVAEGPCWAVITALIEESSPAEHRGRNVGWVVSAAALVGLAVAPVLTTQVGAHWGWRAAFFVAGVPGIVLGALLAKFVREPETSGAGHAPGHGIRGVRDYLSLLRYRNIWLCALGAVGFMTWLFLVNVFAPLYITKVAGQSGTTAGFLLGATGLGSFVLAVILPGLSDRVGRKPLLISIAALSAVVPVALLVPELYQHLWLLAGVIFAANGGQCMPALILVLVPTESVPGRFAATAIGLVTLVGEVIGATAAPAIGGRLAERYGLALPLWMAAGGTAVVCLAGLFLKETAGARRGEQELEAALAN
ncbi:MAG TPA: MFS transporter [Candidatus Acidoferrales bacterium]|nr:MFS transporter [Candidatus Acidoferrales bacterium]